MYQQSFHNPYLQGNYSQPIQLQPQQVIQVNGRASAGAMRVKKCLCAVDDELSEAQKWLLNKKAVDYDISHIIGEQ